MKKTLVALAALATTGAFAQVTITGYFGGSYDSFAISGANAARTGSKSENRVSDQSSRLIFNVAEDLGGGMTALGQMDLRFKVDAAVRIQSENSATAGNPAVDPVSGGNMHVGLKHANIGTFKLGRQDIYYGETANYLPAGLFLAANAAPVAMSLPTIGSFANWSRTPNLMWFESNRTMGIQATVGYSTNPLRQSATNEAESNMGTTTNGDKGGGTYVKLNYANGPLDLTYAMIDFNSGYAGGTPYALNAGAVGADQNRTHSQTPQTFLAKYDFQNGLKAAVGWHKNKGTFVGNAAAATTAATATTPVTPGMSSGSTVQANAWTASGIYTSGPSNFVLNYAKRGNVSYDGVAMESSGLTQMTLGYAYDLSKQTSVGVMMTSLKSQANSSAALFYQGNNAYGGQVPTYLGETQKMTSIALRKNF